MALLFLWAFTTVSVSASLDQRIKISNEEENAIFKLPKSGSSYLAFLASDQDASFTFEIDGFNFEKNGEEYSSHATFKLFEPKRWNLMKIFMTKDKKIRQTVTIYPNTVYNVTGDLLEESREISITSHGQIYWTQCNSYHSCNFSGSVLNGTECPRASTVSLTTAVLITVCGLLVLAVVGLLVFIVLRGKEIKPKEHEQNTKEDTINEEVDLSENFGHFHREQMDHESVNSLYGAMIHRQG